MLVYGVAREGTEHHRSSAARELGQDRVRETMARRSMAHVAALPLLLVLGLAVAAYMDIKAAKFEPATGHGGGALQDASRWDRLARSRSLYEVHECQHNPFWVPAPEDVLAERTACSKHHKLHMKEFKENACSNRYGHVLKIGGHPYYWVEVPKAGSSSVEKLVKRDVVKAPPPDVQMANKLPAFVIVRHPIARYLSGYGTIMSRLESMPEACRSATLSALVRMQEPNRFRQFTELFLKEGEKLVDHYWCAKHRTCVMQHVLSQTWFTNLFPGRIDLVMHLENITSDWERLGHFVGKELPPLPAFNVGEGSGKSPKPTLDEDLEGRLIDYFQIDFARFGYTP